MDLANNIRYYRKLNKLTQADLANKLDVAPTAISAWEVGRNKPLMDKIEQMSTLFNVKKSDLLGDEIDTPTNLVPISRASIVSIPILGTIKCGQPILAEDNITGYREELSDRLPSGNLFYLKSQGDSMVPTIPEGSLVLIREQPTVEYGEVAAVLVNGDTEATLKRVKKQGDIVMLIADNPDYPPYIITDDNPARIIGKAVQVSVDL
jgi:SOS-response transcriptional repressor|nr:MAG TPA: Repressor protein CI [Caudoviricetes sp.]